MDKLTREAELSALIKKYATSYYSGVAEVDDDYFDSLVDELKSINPEAEVLKTGWGYDPRKKVSHKYGLHIGSLPKIKTVSGIDSRYDEYTRVSAKLDGLSVVSYYQDGKRVLCVTRGNGSQGQDVTHHMQLISPDETLIKNPDGSLFTGAIRGEVVMPMSVWNSRDKYVKMKKENPSANPRNIASGLLNRKELSKDDALDLAYVVYKVLYSEGYEYDSIDKVDNFFLDLECTSALKYCAPFKYGCNLRSEDSLKEIYDLWSNDYPCDGLVFTNMTGNCEYDEIAYKFQAESVEVTVTDVTFNVTRTGKLAPLIHFDPVELSGAVVRRCTGFNAAFIKDNKVGKGAVIEVCRSNEVIPHIMRVISPEPESNNTLPLICPKCGSELSWSGDDLVCESENEAQLAYHFITTCAPVDGAGYSLYSSIVNSLPLENVDSLSTFLYDIKTYGTHPVESLIKDRSDISGTVTWNKVREILNKLEEPIDPVRLLCACNIKGIGWNVAESIISEYPNFFQDSKSEFDLSKLYSINGIGWKTVQIIDKFRSRIQKLSSSVTIGSYSKEDKVDIKFKVAITGSLSVKRAEFDAQLKGLGIEQSGNFKEIKYLITNNPNSTSSKMRKAQEAGVTVISEEDFRSLYLN